MTVKQWRVQRISKESQDLLKVLAKKHGNTVPRELEIIILSAVASAEVEANRRARAEYFEDMGVYK